MPCFIWYLFLSLLAVDCALDNRPIIGVLLETTPTSETGGKYKMNGYVRAFIEQSGGGVVPVFVNQPDEYYDNLMSRLNGVLLPGGSVDLINSPYGKEAYQIYKAAVKKNINGNYFPILGLCLGMQEMTTWSFNPRQNPISSTDGTNNVGLPLKFTSAASKSRLYGNVPAEIRKTLTTRNVTPNFHHYSLIMATYNKSKELQDLYSVTSTSTDENGVHFVSSLEARDYPFYGLQWHPEVISYWFPPGTKLDHTYEAVEVAQYISNFFVNEARKSKQSFKSAAELSRFLVNNYPTTFDQTYYRVTYFLNDTQVPHFDDSFYKG